MAPSTRTKARSRSIGATFEKKSDAAGEGWPASPPSPSEWESVEGSEIFRDGFRSPEILAPDDEYAISSADRESRQIERLESAIRRSPSSYLCRGSRGPKILPPIGQTSTMLRFNISKQLHSMKCKVEVQYYCYEGSALDSFV